MAERFVQLAITSTIPKKEGKSGAMIDPPTLAGAARGGADTGGGLFFTLGPIFKVLPVHQRCGRTQDGEDEHGTYINRKTSPDGDEIAAYLEAGIC